MSQPKIVVNKHTPSVVEAFTHLGKVIALENPGSDEGSSPRCGYSCRPFGDKSQRAAAGREFGKVVGTVTIGTDHVDERYLASKGITFVSAPGSNSNSVKEYIASALCVWSRRTGRSACRKGRSVLWASEMSEAKLQRSPDARIECCAERSPLRRKTGDEKYRPLDELMDADFITIHVPLTKSGDDATFHLFNEARIGKMKRGAVLINTSRGPVVERMHWSMPCPRIIFPHRSSMSGRESRFSIRNFYPVC